MRSLPATALAALLLLAVVLAPGSDPEREPAPVPSRPAPVAHLGAPLTGPAPGDRAEHVLDYVRAQGKLRARDVKALKRERSTTTNGLTRLRWRQQRDGVTLIDGDLRATVTRDGRIVSVGGEVRPGIADADTTPSITASAARAAAAKRTKGPATATVKRAGTAGKRATTFANGDRAHLVLTAHTGDVKLAWRVIREQGDALYDQLVDAHTGAELRRVNRAQRATALAFENWPGAPIGGKQQPVSLDGWLSSGAATLFGRRADVWLDLDGDRENDPEDRTLASSPGNWSYTRMAFPGQDCPTVGCSWDPARPATTRINRYQAATQAFVTLSRVQDHYRAAPISFDAFRDDDPVKVLVNAGSDGLTINDSGIVVYPEGTSPVMRLSLVLNHRPPLPAVSSAEEPATIAHELAHGLAGRLVTDGEGWEALTQLQADALDEGLADFYALDWLVDTDAIADGPASGDVRFARFADPQSLVYRHQGIDTPVDEGGFTYDHYGMIDADGPEPHADGEIIAQTLWDLRDALIAAYGQQDGLHRVRLLVTEALREVPAEPTFLDFRNALLLVDENVLAGAEKDRIWTVFAARGMGWYAAATDADDADPKADHTKPNTAAQRAVVHGVVRDRDSGAPLANAQVRFSAGRRLTPDLTARTNAQGEYAIANVPVGTYGKLTVDAVGYERAQRPNLAVGGPATQADLTARRNWADARMGAELVSEPQENEPPPHSCRAQAVLDGSAKSGWRTENSGPRTIEIKLPADVRVSGFALNPTPRCRAADGMMPQTAVIETSDKAGRAWASVGTIQLAAGHRHKFLQRPTSGAIEGVRRVRLTLSDPLDPAAKDLSIAEFMVFATPVHPPRAVFAATPDAPDVDEEVTFDARGSKAGSAAIVGYRWDLDGDGTYERDTGTTPTVKHAFDESGTHTVRLQVTAQDGETDEFRAAVAVGLGVEIFDLGTAAPEDHQGRAVAITPRGDVVGMTGQIGRPEDPWTGTTHALRYRDGQPAALAGLPGATRTIAWDANDLGQTVGVSDDDTSTANTRAVLWNGDVPTDLGTLGGTWALGQGMNSGGTVVGESALDRDRWRAFVKPLGAPMEDIQVLAGVPERERTNASATDVSDSGVVVGCVGMPEPDRCGQPIRFSGGTLTRLPSLASGAALSINESGEIAGWVSDHALHGHQAARWSAAGTLERMDDLGGPSVARTINEAGTIVGHAGDQLGRTIAFRWRRGRPMEDLNRYVRGTRWSLVSAEGINDRDEIVGTGLVDGVRRAYQLSLGPCRVCVEQVTLQERDVASGEWAPVGADGTVDGNRVRALVKVANRDTRHHVARVNAHDENVGAFFAAPVDPVSLEPGQERTVTLEYDTEGLAWNAAGGPDSDHVIRFLASRGRTTYNSRGAVLKIRPKPLVLVHGEFATAGAWDAMAEQVRRVHPDWRAVPVGGMDTGNWTALDRETPGVERNAAVLAEAVRTVRMDEDAARVDVVAHGLGGLIARQYVHTLSDLATPVEHLLMLGTPNLGTPCAELAHVPAVYQLRRELVAAFNTRVTERRGVQFAAFSGSAAAGTCGTAEPGDGVSGVTSQRWTLEDVREAPVLHGEMIDSGLVLRSFIVPHVAGLPEGPGAPAGEKRAAADDEGAAAPRARAAAADVGEDAPRVLGRTHDLLARELVALAPGATVDTPLTVDGGSRIAVQVLASPRVTAELVAPNGTVVQRIVAGQGEGRAPVRSLVADDPDRGRWLVRLQSTAQAAEQAQVAAQLEEDRWELDLRYGRAPGGGPTPLLAIVERDDRRVPGATVDVSVKREGRAPVTVTLLDEAGTGCYRGAVQLEAGAAVATLRAQALGQLRLREAWMEVRAGDGAAPACPARAGRNGELVFNQLIGTQRSWGAVKPSGQPVDPPPLSPFVQRAAHSPDGTRIGHVSVAGVTIANADGSEERTLPLPPAHQRSGLAWAHDGRRVAYSECQELARCGIVIHDLEANTRTVVPNTQDVDAKEPTWSPDGERLAFTGALADGRDIYVIDVDGGARAAITRGMAIATSPAWSPDGYRIAFSGFDQYRRDDQHYIDAEIFTVEPDGTGLSNLTRDPECDDDCPLFDSDENPVWSPDGRRIAYTSERGETVERSFHVWTMRPDGGGKRKLTSGVAWRERPSWRALPYLQDPTPPECDELTATVPHDGRLRIKLMCGDPNGDPLSVRVLTPPAHGTLGAVEDDHTVVYTPSAGYAGADTFTYAASDGDNDASPATVNLTVQAAPPPPPPPPPPHVGGAVGGGGGAGGGGPSHGQDDPAPPGGSLPPSCNVDPRTNQCFISIPCAPGGDISNCTMSLSEVAGGASAAKAPRRAKLVKPVKLRVPAGTTARLKMRLTPGAVKRLKRAPLKVRLKLEVRATGSGKLLSRQTRTVTFRKGKR
ncbi:M36 family metallopeptidase [Solirubrobacter sp. CPCC 204708]|uniref:alpha-amylase n=1 Tax=Solirubrobacter deserti TaxID=2282478 RepID=A0ABT4RCG7_9ACTN|nr:M36 family metallopeptidase [Solirubrobacter deserti]MBE2315574.1 M36 family metallopeptidase [Solirubrobacter deserti]MDA0136213.1 M36 family metallopeptidase [Solirubrobacter deserti]